jgi:hypothetical protein
MAKIEDVLTAVKTASSDRKKELLLLRASMLARLSNLDVQLADMDVKISDVDAADVEVKDLKKK